MSERYTIVQEEEEDDRNNAVKWKIAVDNMVTWFIVLTLIMEST